MSKFRLDQLVYTPLQEEAIAFGKSHRGALFFLPPRAGKTVIACGLIQDGIPKAKQPFQGLVVCLLANKMSTWARHLESIQGLHVATTMDEYRALRGKVRCLLVHYDALHTEDYYSLEGMQFHMSIVDESHKLNGKSSQSFRVLRNVRSLRKYLFTGSPSHTDLDDLYHQVSYIDETILGTSREFKKAYQRQDRYNQWVLRPDKYQDFMDAIEPLVFQRGYDSVGLHKPKMIKVDYQLTETQKALYKEMDKEGLVTTPKGHKVIGVNSIVKPLRLRQILNGFLPIDKKTSEVFGTGKVPALLKLLKDRPTPTIVFYQYEDEKDLVESAVRASGLTYVTISGKTRKPQRAGLIEQFRSGQKSVIVMQVTIGGVGLDLPEAKTMIMYSLPNSAIYLSQAINRHNFIGLDIAPEVYYLSSGKKQDQLPIKNLEAHYRLWDKSRG